MAGKGVAVRGLEPSSHAGERHPYRPWKEHVNKLAKRIVLAVCVALLAGAFVYAMAEAAKAVRST